LRRLLPLLALGYGVAYIDRVNISFAALQMNEELHFTQSIYGLGAGLFSLGYCLLEIPSNIVLARVGARRWISRIMLTWGLLAVGMMFIRTPHEFYIMRFLLGVAEAGFFPGVLFYLRQWVPPQFGARAISRFYIAVPLGAAFMGAVSGALLDLHGAAGLSGWQWLFLIQGIPALLLSAAIWRLLPEDPRTVPWLSEAERGWLLQLLPETPASQPFAAQGLRGALARPLVWKFGLCNFLIMGASYAFAFSAPKLLQITTQWKVLHVGFFMSATGLVGAAAMLGNGWHSDLKAERHLHVAAPLLLMSAMQFLIAATHSPAILLPAYVFYYMGVYAVQAAFWPIPSLALRGPDAAVGLAAIGSLGIFGGFVGPSLWGLALQHTGSFHAGLLTAGTAFLLAAVLMVRLRHHE
jgi:ACS family tartrate transporter-like MFS transporter